MALPIPLLCSLAPTTTTTTKKNQKNSSCFWIFTFLFLILFIIIEQQKCSLLFVRGATAVDPLPWRNNIPVKRHFRPFLNLPLFRSPTVNQRTGDLFILDEASRIFFYSRKSLDQGAQEPDFVIGQTEYNGTLSLCSQDHFIEPVDMQIDSSERVWLVDIACNSVLFFPLNISSELSTHKPYSGVLIQATVVFGQANFSDAKAESSSGHLDGPFSLAYDNLNDNLFVADTDNKRIVLYANASKQITDPYRPKLIQPTLCFGEGITSCDSVGGVGPSDTSFNFPIGLALDSHQNLFVAERNSRRVVRIPYHAYSLQPVGSHVISADMVLGAINFTSISPPLQCTARTFIPEDITYIQDFYGDGSGIDAFAIPDRFLSRVTIFTFETNSPIFFYNSNGTLNFEPASFVQGQDNFTWCEDTPGPLTSPSGVAFDHTRKILWVSNGEEFFEFDLASPPTNSTTSLSVSPSSSAVRSPSISPSSSPSSSPTRSPSISPTRSGIQNGTILPSLAPFPSQVVQTVCFPCSSPDCSATQKLGEFCEFLGGHIRNNKKDFCCDNYTPKPGKTFIFKTRQGCGPDSKKKLQAFCLATRGRLSCDFRGNKYQFTCRF